MRHTRFYLLFALLISLLVVNSVSGQRRSRSRTAEKTFVDVFTVSDVTFRDVPAKRAFNHNEKIDWRYDNVKDITVVNLDKMWVGSHLRLSAYFGCYGQGCDQSTPSYVRFFITTSS
jgi:hypothetical protein